MPKSRVRKKPVYTPPPTRSSKHKVSPVWLAPVMVACLLIGLAWIALYYVTQANMPVLSALGGWNLVCGFCLIVAGVVLATQWRLSPLSPGGTTPRTPRCAPDGVRHRIGRATCAPADDPG